MTKFLLGVAVGYVFHTAIDKAVQTAASTFEKKVDEVNDNPTTPGETPTP